MNLLERIVRTCTSVERLPVLPNLEHRDLPLICHFFLTKFSHIFQNILKRREFSFASFDN